MSMVPDEPTKAEEYLFEELNKFSDRFPSLINLILVIAGLSFTILTFSLDKTTGKSITDIVNDINITYWFCFLSLAFLVSVLSLIATHNVSRLVKNGNSIMFRNANEQNKNNMKLFTLVEEQKAFYIIATGSAAVSIPALFNYFAKNSFLSCSLPITLILLILVSVLIGVYYMLKLRKYAL